MLSHVYSTLSLESPVVEPSAPPEPANSDVSAAPKPIPTSLKIEVTAGVWNTVSLSRGVSLRVTGFYLGEEEEGEEEEEK